ncbi:homocysteine S-methyltransferase family protein [Flavihumibacter sp. R14]|nr:homocysteine S-methyltransferase family protein [Flavihumibacter soli]
MIEIPDFYRPDKLYLTDGGLETTLIFRDHYDLPYFAAFELLKTSEGYDSLRKYFTSYLNIAREYNTGFVLESATWRASTDWILKLGYPEAAVSEINNKAVRMLLDLRNEYRANTGNIIISGCIGPRGDGYSPTVTMTVEEARKYHMVQAKALVDSGVDMITAITMNYVEEAAGIVAAANELKVPVVISFTVETNGQLPTGMTLEDAINQVDANATIRPVYYMINCAHPAHFTSELNKGLQEEWTMRIRGIRANASCKSHAELDEATELDRGDPRELGISYKHLKESFGQLHIFGGCCGTDEEHVHEIAGEIAAFY